MWPPTRDPTLARALVEALHDPRVVLARERDPAGVESGEIHVYGRDQTILAVKDSARAGVRVCGHGPGLGVAVVTRGAHIPDVAEGLARDVVAFDQRGCLSPRLAVVVGDEARARDLAASLHDRLLGWGERVPRGVLSDEERGSVAAWCRAHEFVGQLWSGAHHAVGLGCVGTPILVAPPGRHVQVISTPSLDTASALVAPCARFIVAVGSDDPDGVRAIAPSHARLSHLGRMQRPVLDGPVDRRGVIHRVTCPG
jgi:hypothetical protein